MRLDNCAQEGWQSACAKVILTGEHAVVYGIKAVAAGIPNAIRARAVKSTIPSVVRIPAWGLALDFSGSRNNDTEDDRSASLVHQTFVLICRELGLVHDRFDLEIVPSIPHAAGLGASAAVAVASIRALSACFKLDLDDERVNAIAFECERLAHGTPSGIDNTLSTYGGVVSYQRSVTGEVTMQSVPLAADLSFVVGLTGKKGYTAQTVARVRAEREQETARYDAIFSEIADISEQVINILQSGDTGVLPTLLSRNQVCLRDLGVSCDEIEEILMLADGAGAEGGKLTGSGDGGAVLISAVNADPVHFALAENGYKSFEVQFPAAKT